MKSHRILILFFIFLLSIFCLYGETSGEKDNDETLRSKLMGTWKLDRTMPNGVIAKGTTLLSTNMTFVTKGVISVPDKKPVQIEYEGTWVVKDGVLIETITKHEDSTKIGKITRDAVIRVDDKEFVYKTEKGDEIKRERKVD